MQQEKLIALLLQETFFTKENSNPPVKQKIAFLFLKGFVKYA